MLQDVVLETRRSSARFDIVSSFDHLALDLVELVQTVGPKFQTGLPVCSGGLNCAFQRKAATDSN